MRDVVVHSVNPHGYMQGSPHPAVSVSEVWQGRWELVPTGAGFSAAVQRWAGGVSLFKSQLPTSTSSSLLPSPPPVLEVTAREGKGLSRSHLKSQLPSGASSHGASALSHV